MHNVTILWSMGASAALTLAVLYGLVWAVERRDQSYLMFCLYALAAAASARVELGMMHSATPAEFGEWVRWLQVPVFVSMAAQLFFVRSYLGSGRVWLAWIVIAIRLVVLIAGFLVSPNFNFEAIRTVQHVSLLGEQITVIGDATVRTWQWLPSLSLLLVILFLADAAAQRWRAGTPEARRKALVVAAGILAPTLASYALAFLLLHAGWHIPILGAAGFLVTITVMAFELGRGAMVSRREQRELEELRQQLARAGRVSALGQLASALAHELGQPLTAILHNAEAGDLMLQSRSLAVDELRAILADIRADDRRAGEVVSRMRALIKQRRLELQPLAINDLLRDVFALVHSEAITRRVALDVTLETNLPPVLGDRVHLCQVLLNLVMNGMDAIDSAAGDARRIGIGAQVNGARLVTISVTDSGSGVPAEMLERIFDPFFTTKATGMGMGLAISRAIIDAHGGRLWAEQETSRSGLTVSFTLQRAAAAA